MIEKLIRKELQVGGRNSKMKDVATAENHYTKRQTQVIGAALTVEKIFIRSEGSQEEI